MSGRPFTKLVYAIQAAQSRRVKFGIAGNVQQRLAELQCGNPEPLEVLATKPGDASHERHIHTLLADYRLKGEWFEWSAPTQALVEALRTGNWISVGSLVEPIDAYEHWRIQPFEHTLAWLGYFAR